MIIRPRRSPLFPYTTLFRSANSSSRLSVDNTAKMVADIKRNAQNVGREIEVYTIGQVICRRNQKEAEDYYRHADRKSTRLNSSHGYISYAVFCLKKKTRPLQ